MVGAEWSRSHATVFERDGTRLRRGHRGFTSVSVPCTPSHPSSASSKPVSVCPGTPCASAEAVAAKDIKDDVEYRDNDRNDHGDDNH